MKQMLAGAVLAAVAATVALAATSGEEFVKKAAHSGKFEVESSQLALDKSQDQDVRDFAQEMIEDHEKANAELKTVAQQANLNVPAEMDRAHKEKLDRLENADADFDSLYKTMQLEGHEKAVELFQTYAEEGDNQALRRFAEKTLPTLKEHKENIEALTQGAQTTR